MRDFVAHGLQRGPSPAPPLPSSPLPLTTCECPRSCASLGTVFTTATGSLLSTMVSTGEPPSGKRLKAEFSGFSLTLSWQPELLSLVSWRPEVLQLRLGPAVLPPVTPPICLLPSRFLRLLGSSSAPAMRPGVMVLLSLAAIHACKCRSPALPKPVLPSLALLSTELRSPLQPQRWPPMPPPGSLW